MPQKLLTPEASAALRQLDDQMEQTAVSRQRLQIHRRRRRRLSGIVGLTTLAVLVLFSQVGGPQSGWREQWVVVGIHAIPALVAFVLGWRMRRFRGALAASATLMLVGLLAILGAAAARDGWQNMLSSLWSWYAARELGRFVVIGIAAGVGGFALRRLTERLRGRDRNA